MQKEISRTSWRPIAIFARNRTTLANLFTTHGDAIFTAIARNERGFNTCWNKIVTKQSPIKMILPFRGGSTLLKGRLLRSFLAMNG